MLRDPLLRERALEVVRAGVGERRVGAADRVREPARALQPVQRRLPARAQHRPRRRDRPDPAQPARLARGAVARAAARARGAGRGRPAAVRGGRARLGPRARDRDRRRLVHLPHRDHRPLARIPAVAGLKDATRRIPPGALVAVDGARGEVVVEPSPEALATLRAAQERHRREDERLRGTRGLAACTPDGVAVRARGQRRVPRGGGHRAALRGPGDRPLPLGVPARPRPALPDGGAAARRLPPPARADAPLPGHGADLGRGRRGARPRPARRARTPRSASGRCGCCAAPRSPSGCSCGRCCGPARTGRSGSCSRS